MSENKSVIPAEAVEAAARAIYHVRLSNIVVPLSREEHLAIALRDARAALEAAAPHIAAEALDSAALDFELSPHNTKAKMARHFNNTYVDKLRDRAEQIRERL